MRPKAKNTQQASQTVYTNRCSWERLHKIMICQPYQHSGSLSCLKRSRRRRSRTQAGNTTLSRFFIYFTREDAARTRLFFRGLGFTRTNNRFMPLITNTVIKICESILNHMLTFFFANGTSITQKSQKLQSLMYVLGKPSSPEESHAALGA